jgi:hypothetical protein
LPETPKKEPKAIRRSKNKIKSTQEAAPDPMEILAETTVVARRLWKRQSPPREEAMDKASKLRQRTAKPPLSRR